jgi:tetratricopeptide (TPR) repeat protein
MADSKASTASTNLVLKGGAAIVAPVTAFAGAIPQNALIVIPLREPSEELTQKLSTGAVALTPEQLWPLLGLNGPPVQVQSQDGNPITIGLNDLLEGLDKSWKEDSSDLNRGRIYAQELMKHGRPAEAEKVLAKVVALGGTGEDWLGLGVAQLANDHLDKAEGSLKGAQNLLPQSPFPSLHLAKLYRKKEDAAQERTMVEKAIVVDPKCVDAWAYLYTSVRAKENEEAAVKAVEELASAPANKASAAPYVALQGFYSGEQETRDKALEFAKVAVQRDPDDSLSLISLSALHGQKGELDKVIEVLKNHENKMTRDVRLANNYFEALMASRDLEKVTRLLNALVASTNREVKQFAIERSRVVAQLLQQQRAKAAAVPAPAPKA